MNFNKTIIKGLIIGISLLSIAEKSQAALINNYRLFDNKKTDGFENNKVEKNNRGGKSKGLSKNVIPGSVLNVKLSTNKYVPDLTGNPDRYETIVVSTTGNKRLEQQDYDNLRNSDIPNIDLSGAQSSSNEIPEGAFSDATNLKTIKFPSNVTSIADASSYSKGVFYNCTSLVGDLEIPSTITHIGSYAFYGCNGLDGNILILDTVTSMGDSAFENCNNIKSILIKVNNSDSNTNYKKNIIDKLNDNAKTIIDVPYDFKVEGTWLETTNKTVGKPVIKNLVNEVESDIVNKKGKIVTLAIPALYKESNIAITKDGVSYTLPKKDSVGKYKFTEVGTYKVTITTDLGNISVIEFEVEGEYEYDYTEVEDAVKKAESTKNALDVSAARELVNKLPNSPEKDVYTERLNIIFEEYQISPNEINSNADISIKATSTLSISLNTNSVVFEEYSGTEDVEKLGAIKMVVSSSSPYSIMAYLPGEIQGSNSDILDKSILKIKEGTESVYQSFPDSNAVTLKNISSSGTDINHNIDLKVGSSKVYPASVYKVTIMIEVEQK